MPERWSKTEMIGQRPYETSLELGDTDQVRIERSRLVQILASAGYTLEPSESVTPPTPEGV
jgi:hypothetical protein